MEMNRAWTHTAERLPTSGLSAPEFRAVGTQAPEGDFGLFDEEAGIVGGRQARCLTDRAVDIDDEIA